MKITIYKLIGMLKDNKAPKKIKINENILNLKIGEGTFYKFETGGMLSFDYYIENNKLDTIVEIIEEDKKIEKLKMKYGITLADCVDKINEIIDKVNSMEDK